MINTTYRLDREEIRDQVKQQIRCTEYLKPAPNHRGNKGYICPICGSGTHNGRKSTGACEYYPDTNKWYCHKCHNDHTDKPGDVIDLYRLANNTDYSTALAELADKIGLNLPSTGKYDASEKNGPAEATRSAETDARQGVTPLQDKTAQEGAQSATEPQADYTAYYRYCGCGDLTDPAAIEYITGRGISIQTANNCNIGYDAAADPAIAPGATGAEFKAHPAPRIIVPCTNHFYYTRSIDAATPAQYKAVNPGGSSTKPFFNCILLAAKQPTEIIFITEGIFDALSFIECGAPAAALNGAGNGNLLLEYIDKYHPQTSFIICPDNDSNHETAESVNKFYKDLNEKLRQRGYHSIIYNVAGDQHDANDALQADRAQFAERIQEAKEALKMEYPDSLDQFINKIQTDAYKPYKTGLQFFDDLLGGGIMPQTMLLLLAAPSTGKTTLAQQIAETMAAERKKVIYLNFEMSAEQMLAKAISAKLCRSGIMKTATDILQGYNWTDAERDSITQAVEEYRRTNYPYIKYNPDKVSANLESIKDYLQRIGEQSRAAGENAPALIVDYLHLITTSKNQDVKETIKEALEVLKGYAINYHTFVIGIVATNRASNQDGKIHLESGRDSSTIEYTADYQISLNYKNIDDKTVKPDNAEDVARLQSAPRRSMILRVLKHRLGQQGNKAYIQFDAAHNIFGEFTPADDAEADIFKPKAKRY